MCKMRSENIVTYVIYFFTLILPLKIIVWGLTASFFLSILAYSSVAVLVNVVLF